MTLFWRGIQPQSGHEAAEKWLQMKDRPTAMFCASDREAFGFISRLAKDGVKVPEDVSVIGFDDIEVSGFLFGADHCFPTSRSRPQSR